LGGWADGLLGGAPQMNPIANAKPSPKPPDTTWGFYSQLGAIVVAGPAKMFVDKWGVYVCGYVCLLPGQAFVIDVPVLVRKGHWGDRWPRVVMRYLGNDSGYGLLSQCLWVIRVRGGGVLANNSAISACLRPLLHWQLTCHCP